MRQIIICKINPKKVIKMIKLLWLLIVFEVKVILNSAFVRKPDDVETDDVVLG